MKKYKKNIEMIETLDRTKSKANNAVEVVLEHETVIVLKTATGCEICVFDTETGNLKSKITH